MKSLRAALLLLLSYCLGVQPVVAQVQSAHVIAPVGVSGSAAAAAGSVTATPSSLNGLGLLQPSALTLSAPAFQSAPALSAPSAAASAMPSAAAAAAVSAAASQALVAAPVAGKAVTPAQFTRERIAPIEAAASKAVEGLEKAGSDASRSQAAVQFSALTGERLRAYADGSETPAAAPKASETGASSSGLSKAAAPNAEAPKAEVPAPKSGITTVFKDPARNSAFWRYITGYSVFLVGFEMYVVGLPYLISAMTRNSLKENGDARAANDEAVKALIRSNRSLARIAHWVAQGISYITIPLFMRNTETEGPKKWWVRATFIRAAALGLVPVLFFTTGYMGLGVALGALLVLLAAQSFFQGIAVTAEGAATTIIMGDKSVTADERTKANSIITVIAAVIAIIAPAIAGQIALIGPIMGKGGVGGAVIFGIYAATTAIAGFIYATIKLVRSKEHVDHVNLPRKATAEKAPAGLKGTLKELWVSIKDGTRIVLKDRLLRMLLIMSMVSSLFSDPLVFNVLPEYIEGIVTDNPGTLGAIMNVPFLGAFLKSLTSSPMGNFALMMVMTSLGSILAAILIKPLSRLFHKLGFKTEEGLTVPFYFLAALEAPLFFLMIGTHTIIGVVLLYGLQSLAVGFIGIAISGLYQKNLGGQRDKDVNKILAAESLLGIGAAILSTFAYGFLLKDIAIGTSLTIAAVATGIMALLHIAAPFLAFTKAQRHPPEPPPSGPARPNHATPPTGDHNGANSVNSVNL